MHKKDLVKTTPGQLGVGTTDSTIRVVAARTGLAMETLRSWERRYGFPTPGRRTGSNRRLYSAADVERLIAIRRALDRGYRVGDVIDKTMSELEALAGEPATGGGAPELEGPGGDQIEALLVLLERDRVAELEGELRRAAAALGPRRFVTELAHPFMLAVGTAWAERRLSVRHEHLASECLITQVRQMLAGYQDIEARPLVLLATLPGEPHTLALQMVALYLVTLGAKPRLLGGPTPAEEIASSARELGADVVGLSITWAADYEVARQGVRAMRRGLTADVPVWLGGAGAAALGVDDENTRVAASWAAIDGVLADWRGRSAGDGRGRPAGDGRGQPAGDGRGQPAGDGRGQPAGDGRGQPVGDGRGQLVSDGRGQAVGDGRGQPVGDGRGQPVGDGRGQPVDEGRAP